MLLLTKWAPNLSLLATSQPVLCRFEQPVAAFGLHFLSAWTADIERRRLLVASPMIMVDEEVFLHLRNRVRARFREPIHARWRLPSHRKSGHANPYCTR